MATSPLPGAVRQEVRRIGAGIRTARLRRGMSQEELAERANVSFHTIRAVENGRPTTGIGHYLNVAWVMGLLSTANSFVDPAEDREGLILEDVERRQRSGGAAKAGRGMSRDF